jgi:hypothetical protein
MTRSNFLCPGRDAACQQRVYARLTRYGCFAEPGPYQARRSGTAQALQPTAR